VLVCFQVPVAPNPQENDYLEMLYRLLPKEELDDDTSIDALPKQPQDNSPFPLYLTVSLRPDATSSPLGLSPLPVVLRAYGAYGLAADLSFCPDDLPLLDRYALSVLRFYKTCFLVFHISIQTRSLFMEYQYLVYGMMGVLNCPEG
jgi:hypothetical protein